jgi:hypothetical protein
MSPPAIDTHPVALEAEPPGGNIGESPSTATATTHLSHRMFRDGSTRARSAWKQLVLPPSHPRSLRRPLRFLCSARAISVLRGLPGSLYRGQRRRGAPLPCRVRYKIRLIEGTLRGPTAGRQAGRTRSTLHLRCRRGSPLRTASPLCPRWRALCRCRLLDL